VSYVDGHRRLQQLEKDSQHTANPASIIETKEQEDLPSVLAAELLTFCSLLCSWLVLGVRRNREFRLVEVDSHKDAIRAR
jgi:hypothetical protein